MSEPKKQIDLSSATTIKENWEAYKKAYFLPSVENFPPNQVYETEKTFYAAFMAALGTMSNIAGMFDDEKEAAQVYENMRLEARAFFQKKMREWDKRKS